ncbi:hypothetical protein [Gordonia sp. (in: high G+C Gram-positive bacteria)]|uniref:hypothetical protein n=1 Tax=Gordonia sp. (in: high G+C Gram-positive bacteria) TaxID=84139 RepID=UPI0026288804|nr:hypothetical protein [Gordonia sp. (in: high G+C Gram-positive bacteria)]
MHQLIKILSAAERVSRGGVCSVTAEMDFVTEDFHPVARAALVSNDGRYIPVDSFRLRVNLDDRHGWATITVTGRPDEDPAVLVAELIDHLTHPPTAITETVVYSNAGAVA